MRAISDLLVNFFVAAFVALGALVGGMSASTADALRQGSAASPGPISTSATGARCVGTTFDDTGAFQAALDTGRTVYAPALGGHCHVTRPLVMRTPGQIIHGDGRARTRIEVGPDFAGRGVFVAATGEPGPVWRDLAVAFAQPDVADRAKLVRYPPAFLARATPRFEMDHVGCYLATICIDMTGNSGGATISDLQMSAFETGIDIDGALDTVRIIDPHWWPFGMSPQQQKIFLAQDEGSPVALNIGRMDDLALRGGLFLGGLALRAHLGKTGPMFGTITGTDFDTTSGIVLDAGSLQIAGATFTMGLPGAQGIRQTGGDINASSSLFLVGPQLTQPVVKISGGRLTMSSDRFETNSFDVTSVDQVGSQSVLIATGNAFSRLPNRPYRLPTLILKAGRTIAEGNFASDKGIGAGVFMQIENDNPFNRIIGNSSPGWPSYAPISRRGVYLLN